MSMTFCPGCGARLLIETQRFCGDCGFDLVALRERGATASRSGAPELRPRPPATRVPAEPDEVAEILGGPAPAALIPEPLRATPEATPPGRDVTGQPETSLPGAPEIAVPGLATAAQSTEVHEPPSPPSAVLPARSRRRSRRVPLLALGVVIVIVAGAAVGSLLILRGGSKPQPSRSVQATAPLSAGGGEVLTSPRPQPAVGLADPETPAYEVEHGFTPDAVRVLTALSLQVSLERYRADTGAYPATLASLFPTYAPRGSDGRPMSAPPSSTDGYTYAPTGGAYTLSVVLASSQPYTLRSPEGR